jgi:hypothetical protein
VSAPLLCFVGVLIIFYTESHVIYMSFVRKHIKAYCLLFFHVVEQMLSGWLVASRHSWRNLRMRMYRIHSRDFLVLCEQYMPVSLVAGN